MAVPIGEGVVPNTSSPDALRSATARNLAAWHDVSAGALGLRTRTSGISWAALDPIPLIFFDWIGLDAHAEASDVLATFPPDRPLVASDPWRAIDLGGLGFRAGSRQPWMVREAGPLPAALTPLDLEVERVRDPDALAAFEATSLAGFEAPAVRPFTYHAPAVLADSRARFWIGRVDGRPIATAMAFVEAGVVGVYGVATVPAARRRGYATALTAIALSTEPGCPAVLQPSPVAEGLYARLGFRRFAEFGTWLRRR